MKTINEIYKLIKQKKDEVLDLFSANINESRNKLFNDIKTNKDIDMNDYSNLLQDGDLLKVKIDLYEDILNLIEESGVLEDEKLKDMALELACENIRDMYCSDYCIWARGENCKGRCCYEQYYDKEKILDQAKEKLEKGKQDGRLEAF